MLSIDFDVTKQELRDYAKQFGIRAAADYAAFVGLPCGICRAWLLG
jgi:hypothetical protein